jgi:hypothetical protein
MFRITATILAVTMLGVGFVTSASAQSPTEVASGTTAKQVQKEQSKAERKARRAKKNAELGELEKNGYRPAGDQTNYPQDYQNAQKKIDAKQAAKPSAASAP